MSNGPEVLMADGAQKRQGDSLVPQGVACRVTRATSQSLSAATFTVVAFDRKDFDPYNAWDTVNNRFQPKLAGYYRIGGSFLFNSMASGGVVLGEFWKNGSGGLGRFHEGHDSNVNEAIGGSGSDLIYFNGTTDYLDMRVYTSIANSLAAGYTYFTANLASASVGVMPEPWHYVGTTGEPAYQNGWHDYAAGRGVRFFKDPHGIVHLDGITGGGNHATSAFTLPPGYRAGSIGFNQPIVGTNTSMYAEITSAGLVSIYNGGSPTTYAYLSGVNFRAEQ